MKDFLDNELNIGDEVIVTGTYGKAKNLHKGIITAFKKAFGIDRAEVTIPPAYSFGYESTSIYKITK